MRPKGKRILIVDDELPIQRILRKSLHASGYEVLAAYNGEQALEIVRLHQPDLILLDLCMPGPVSGLDVCVAVRKQGKTPIIVVSALIDEKEKVRALDLGADDYLTKPFGNNELMARVRACLRRAQTTETEEEEEPELLVSEDKYIYMDVVRRQVRVGGQDVRLTPTEFELLRYLMQHSGRVLTHRQLLRSVWGPEYGDEADYLRVYVRQLRLKVEEEPSRPRYIITEPGVGYVFRSPMKRENI
ncbi:two-component system KDP operon response regulator KdpE [Thermosporothrix hazakensis]|jgi:two-component system KDP operon response regulator KdpE|uniref:Two-component system KDP operon response regulator KdpE n=2 Tax=Thermosporothrix TaxID=768650 RepID=A0A326UL30_THEHA|nr:response regulator transcription factor [Thermosporothrix hazakensis]PZW30454.1 two-component system KDP operon response regulator KdpE [Thermosporothrix hazakensis]BBH91169.1 DNA-binding response regulator [Thermosporothrix sp. COM3]GCE49314.1 DNA-binding response regulator [Thermosporothrix hazakensis]